MDHDRAKTIQASGLVDIAIHPRPSRCLEGGVFRYFPIKFQMKYKSFNYASNRQDVTLGIYEVQLEIVKTIIQQMGRFCNDSDPLLTIG